MKLKLLCGETSSEVIENVDAAYKIKGKYKLCSERSALMLKQAAAHSDVLLRDLTVYDFLNHQEG